MLVWHTHTNTHTVESAISLFPPSFIFSGFSTRCSLCEKYREMRTHTHTHSLCELCCVCWARVGDVFSRRKAILWRQFLSALNYLLSLTRFIYGHHVQLEEKLTGKIAVGFLYLCSFLCAPFYGKMYNINSVNRSCFAVSVNDLQMG